MSTPAAAYEIAMAQEPTGTPPAIAEPKSEAVDTVMTDIPLDATTSHHAATPTSTPHRTGTPSASQTPHRHINGDSRSASLHPETQVQAHSIPTEVPPHGAPVRQYLNGKVTASLLDGMKILARDQPKDPLKVLGEFLLQRSRELEGSQ